MKTSNTPKDAALREALRRLDYEAVGGKAIYRKIAAIFLAATFLGGLAWAISPLLHSSKSETNRAAQVTVPSQTVRAGGESFSGLRLDSILAIVASHYDREVCFRDEALCSLQFYTTWDKQLPLDSFLTTLNEFDGLRLSDERDTIFVEKR